MTFGLFRPVILCGAAAESPEAKMVLGHEIVHIKRFDVLWKILLRLAVILHWWNPAVWLVRRDFERACECSCDDMALRGKAKEEIKAYMRLSNRSDPHSSPPQRLKAEQEKMQQGSSMDHGGIGYDGKFHYGICLSGDPYSGR